MLLTFSDFVAFKEMFLDFRAVSTFSDFVAFKEMFLDFRTVSTFSDFVAFKEMFLDFRAVSTCLLLYITHIIRAPPSINTLLLSHSIHNYYVV